MKVKITIQDVAKRAQVSMMTVSRVINQAEAVKPQTREKVQKAMEELGYFPNLTAQRLSRGKSGLFGVACYEPNSAYVSQFLYGCIRTLTSMGLHMLVEDIPREASISEQLESLGARVDGLIILPPISEQPEAMEYIYSQDMPVALIGNGLSVDREQKTILSVNIADFDAAREMTQYLIDQGHTAIGFITGDMGQRVSRARLEGYRQAMADNQLSVNEAWIQEGDYTYRSALTAARPLVTMASRPTAIFASNDDMAAAVIAVAGQHGLNVPQDLSVVGVDDANTATLIWPQLTTIRQPLEDMAQGALEFVVNNKFPAGAAPFPYTLVKRDSVAPPHSV